MPPGAILPRGILPSDRRKGARDGETTAAAHRTTRTLGTIGGIIHLPRAAHLRVNPPRRLVWRATGGAGQRDRIVNTDDLSTYAALCRTGYGWLTPGATRTAPETRAGGDPYDTGRPQSGASPAQLPGTR